MSRHVLVDRPTIQVVLGFDHMLRSFFGQVFRPRDRRSEGMAVAGWPTRSGLGTPRTPRLGGECELDLNLLMLWGREQQPFHVWDDPDAAAHMVRLRSALRFEWDEGEDYPDMPVPAVLRESR